MSVVSNPLLVEWTGPYGGVLPLNNVPVECFDEAFAIAMREELAEIDRIANQTAPPTFENSIEALERTGRTLSRVTTLYDICSSTRSTPEFQQVDSRVAPLLSKHRDSILQNKALFDRIEAVHGSNSASLNDEQKRLTFVHWNRFVHNGARLSASDKGALADINSELASLYAEFNKRVLAEEEQVTFIGSGDLDGLPASFVAAAAAAAATPDKYAIVNTRSSVEPFLSFSTRRDLRRIVFDKFVKRGENGNANDTSSLITQILALRQRRARLLGKKSHAHWSLEDSSAGTPQRALDLMKSVWPATIGRIREEVTMMQKLADVDGVVIEAHDYRFYAEKLRQQQYDMDMTALEEYFQLDNLRCAMFDMAERLFGLQFKRVDLTHQLPLMFAEQQVYEVVDKQATIVGLWYFDPFFRAGKRSGAWMSEFRRQENFDGRRVLPIVSNNCNFIPVKNGPVLISFDDAITLFHEFGHGLHGLLSNVSYPTLAGTSVFSDYVEFPSQLCENWLTTREMLSRWAVNVRGERIPEELVAKLMASKTYGQGFSTGEYLASALLDMELHMLDNVPEDLAAFERATLGKIDMPSQLVCRHRLWQFSHLFADDHYAAGYYSYLWSDVLAADAFEAFTATGDVFNADVARRLKEHVFARGNSIDPISAYRLFRGRAPDPAALMRKRGFPVTDVAQ